MDDIRPAVISNEVFVGYEEEDIGRITAIEGAKLERNDELPGVRAAIQAQLGPGRWERHWVTLDDDGNRVYALVYLAMGITVAVTADGDVVREFWY